MERVSQNGVAASHEAADGLKPGREKRKNDAVRGACCERWLRPGDGREHRQLCGRTFPLCSLRNLTLHLGNDGLRLGKSVHRL